MSNKIRAIVGKVREFYAFAGEKHTTTFAGGLAYFFFTGLVPFVSLVYSLCLLLNIDPQSLYALFRGGILLPQQIAEEGANKVGTWIMIITAVYSATHFYFHLIRTGENIFGSNRSRGAGKRILSFFYLEVVQLLMLSSLFISVFGSNILEFFGFSAIIVKAANVLITLAFNGGLALLLHLFALPQGRKNVKSALNGALLTFTYWEVCGVVFSILNKLNSNGDFSYSFIAAFLLYLYFLMRGLTFGLALNAFCVRKNSIIVENGENR